MAQLINLSQADIALINAQIQAKQDVDIIINDDEEKINGNIAMTPFSNYQILFDEYEKSHVCHYYNFVECEKGMKFGEIEELKQWVEKVHYPAQIKKYFIEVECKEVEKDR